MNCQFTTTAVHFVTLSTSEHIDVQLTAQLSATAAAAVAGVSCQPLYTHNNIRTRYD